MANQEHLAKLREGVTVWNSWRLENEEVRVELSEADLTGAKLTGAYLGETSFGDTTLTETTGLDACFGREG